MVEGQHGRVAGQHQVRPDGLTRTGRGAGSGVIGDQADHPGGEVGASQQVERTALPGISHMDPVRPGGDERPSAQSAAV